jgi:UDP:flavonoid glycosyltransferase YjiC (YdhE family)
MRLLFCSFDSPGHLFPLVGLTRELQRRGHTVAFATGEPARAALSAAGIDRIPRGVEDGPSFRVNVHHQPLAIAVDVKHVEHAIREFAPDALVTHQLAHAPLMVRERTGIPVAVMGLSTYLWSWSREPHGAGASGLERTRRWRIGSDTAIVDEARKLFRMPPLAIDGPDLPFLGDLFMLRTVPELTPELPELPPQVHAVGACPWEPPRDEPDAWSTLRARFALPDAPLLYVQHGRTFGGPGFWSPLARALADQPVQVVAAVGRMDQEMERVPDNFTVLDHVPQGLVLPHARAVVCGGHTSAVLGALTHAVPSVIVPSGGETQDNAHKVADAGCGIRIGDESLGAETMREAVAAAMAGGELARNCARIQQAFARSAPFEDAADLVEQLAITRLPVHRAPEAAEILSIR